MPPLNSTIDEDVNALLCFMSGFFASIVGAALFIALSPKVPWLLVPGILCSVFVIICPVLFVFRWKMKRENVNVERRYRRWCRILLCLPPQPVDPVAFYRANRSLSGHTQTQEGQENSEIAVKLSKSAPTESTDANKQDSRI